MTVYIILILCILCGTLMPLSKKRYRKLYCTCITIALVLISGLRSKYLGPPNSWGVTDSQNVHIPDFLAASRASWTDIFVGWMSGSNSNFRDLGANYFYKLLSYISTNENFFMFVTSIPLFVAFSRYIYKYSRKPVMSYILLLGLNYFTGSMYLVRHMLALSIVILSLEDLYESKIRNYIVKIIIAFFFHKSAISALAVIPFVKMKWSKKHVIAIGFGLIFGTMATSVWENILILIVKYIPMWSHFMSRDYVNEFGQSWFIGIAILICTLLKKDALYKKYGNVAVVNLNLITIGCICYGFMGLLSEFSRVAMFFMPASIVMLPDAISEFRGQKSLLVKILITSGVYVAFLLYFILVLVNAANANPYRFFWQ